MPTTLRLVPVSADFEKPENVISIPESDQDKELILGRGKLTGIQDIRVSRKQVYVTSHSPQNGPPYLSIIVVSLKRVTFIKFNGSNTLLDYNTKYCFDSHCCFTREEENQVTFLEKPEQLNKRQ